MILGTESFAIVESCTVQAISSTVEITSGINVLLFVAKTKIEMQLYTVNHTAVSLVYLNDFEVPLIFHPTNVGS